MVCSWDQTWPESTSWALPASPAAMLLRRLRRLSWGSTAVQLFILTVVTLVCWPRWPVIGFCTLTSTCATGIWTKWAKSSCSKAWKKVKLPCTTLSCPLPTARCLSSGRPHHGPGWSSPSSLWTGSLASTTSCRWCPSSTRLLQQCGPQCGGTSSSCATWSGVWAISMPSCCPSTSPWPSRYEAPGMTMVTTLPPTRLKKQDYVYCLESSCRPTTQTYVLMVEDDAVRGADLSVLEHLLRTSFLWTPPPDAPLSGSITPRGSSTTSTPGPCVS